MRVRLPSEAVVACEVGVLLAVCGFALAWVLSVGANRLLALVPR